VGGTGEGRFDHRLTATSWIGLPDCIGCGLCAEACPDDLVRIERGKAIRCVHCDPERAPCAQACPCLAIVPKGRTLVIDRDACTGCGLCAEACPIDAVRVTDRAAKCDNCIDRGPFPPPCVEACPVPDATTFKVSYSRVSRTPPSRP